MLIQTVVVKINNDNDNNPQNTAGGDQQLKQTIRLLAMAEQTDVLTAVLQRLNGDKQSWETVQREPVALVAMIIEEQSNKMTELLQNQKQNQKGSSSV
jgi:hypothetical protein